jgi:hypothetical protein
MGVVSACVISFMSIKYLHQSWGPKPMTRVDINDKLEYYEGNMLDEPKNGIYLKIYYA